MFVWVVCGGDLCAKRCAFSLLLAVLPAGLLARRRTVLCDSVVCLERVDPDPDDAPATTGTLHACCCCAVLSCAVLCCAGHSPHVPFMALPQWRQVAKEGSGATVRANTESFFEKLGEDEFLAGPLLTEKALELPKPEGEGDEEEED